MSNEIMASMQTVWDYSESFFLKRPLLKSDSTRRISYVRTNLTLKDRYSLSRDLKKRIRSAQHRVLLTTAYFLPRRTLLRALVHAAKKGCYVGLCLPQKTDVRILQWASRGLFRELLKSGIKIYEYLPSVMHAKTVVIDEWVTIGSHNWNHRSLNHDLEIEVTLTLQEDLAKMVDQWDRDLLVSESITLEKLNKLGWLSLLLGKFFYWFRYWL
jgi:cardiolipin synthase